MNSSKKIPKIIHIVWFGGKPYTKLVEYCVESWKKYCPDYEIRVWNEDTFDVNSTVWTKEAYEAKKWAFLSDYVRLYALYNIGGVYIDSDVELLKNIDGLLQCEAFTGYEDKMWVPAAVMGACKGNEWIKCLLDYYSDRHFVLADGKYDQRENTKIITEISKTRCDFSLGDMVIKKGNVVLYDSDVFQPYKFRQFDMTCEENLKKIHQFYDIKPNKTIAIHHCTGSWNDKANSFGAKVKALIRRFLPRKIVEKLRELYYFIRR